MDDDEHNNLKIPQTRLHGLSSKPSSRNELITKNTSEPRAKPCSLKKKNLCHSKTEKSKQKSSVLVNSLVIC